MNICTTCPFQSLGNDLITNVNLPPIPVDSKRKGQNIAGSSNPKTMKTQNATSQINPSTSAQPNILLISQLSSSASSSSIPKPNMPSVSKSSSSIPRPSNVPSVPKQFPENEKLERPRYYFSKNQWTFDKEQALEKLLMK